MWGGGASFFLSVILLAARESKQAVSTLSVCLHGSSQGFLDVSPPSPPPLPLLFPFGTSSERPCFPFALNLNNSTKDCQKKFSVNS